MKVHFASGTHKFQKPWHNVDWSVAADQKVNLLDEFPGNLNHIEWAYVGHFLEHITPDEGVLFLRRVRERMQHRGRIVVVGPDINKGRAMHERGRLPDHLMAAIGAHGKCDENDPANRGGVHMWNCSGEAVVQQLIDAEWSEPHEFSISQLPQQFPEVPIIDLSAWQFAVTAVNAVNDDE